MQNCRDCRMTNGRIVFERDKQNEKSLIAKYKYNFFKGQKEYHKRQALSSFLS